MCASFQRTKPELRFISKEGPRWSLAMARPFCSNGVKVEVYSWISLDREETVEEEETDPRMEETVLEEGASCIYVTSK